MSAVALAKADDSRSRGQRPRLQLGLFVVNGFGADRTRQPRIFLFSFVGCLSLQARSSFIQFWPCLAGVALAPPTGSSATVSDGSATYANAHRPLTTMVPLMVPLVSPVTRLEHWSVVKLPLAPAYRPVPPIMVQGSTWRRSPLAHKPLLIPKKHTKMLSPLAASPTIKRLPPAFPGGVSAKAKSTGSE